MKKLLQLIIVGAFLNTMAQTLPVPTSGLMAFYGLNATGDDNSGNNIHLTNSSAVGTLDRFQNSNSAMYFSGTGSTCLYLTAGSSLNAANSDLTISFWYRTTNSTYAGIIDNSQAATPNGWGIDNYNGRFRFLGAGNLTGPIYAVDGVWHHIVFVKSGTKGIFYKDNVATDSTNSMTALTAPTTGVQFNVGRRNNFTSYLQSTNLDDIAIYNRALTRQEISDIATYNSYVPEPPLYVPANGLIAHYPFTNTSLMEHSTFAASKMLFNAGSATPTSDRFNNISGAYSFNGGNYLGIANGSALNVTGSEISVSFWYKTASSSYAGFIDNSQAATANGYGIDNFGTNSFRFLGAGNFSASVFNADNLWHHVVYVKSGAFGGFYIDGVLASWANTMSNLTAPSTSVAFRIGGRNNGTSGFIGSIDDVTIYNRILNSAEVSQLYHYNNWDNITTSIIEADNSKNVMIYPNPSNGLFTVETINTHDKASTIQIFDVMGDMVYEKNAVSDLETIDLQNLTNGVYIVKINSAKNTITKKIIKQ